MRENFKFGNGGILPSSKRWRLPAVIADNVVCLWVSAVPVSSLGLLIGRDVLDGLGGVLDFGERTLEQLAAGHVAPSLLSLRLGPW